MTKFNYQIVFKYGKDERIVFVGSTTHKIHEILKYCETLLVVHCDVESFNYSPVNVTENGKKEAI